MPQYRVKPGKPFAGKFKAGEIVELTEVEAKGFPDRLELVTVDAPAPPAAQETQAKPETKAAKK